MGENSSSRSHQIWRPLFHPVTIVKTNERLDIYLNFQVFTNASPPEMLQAISLNSQNRCGSCLSRNFQLIMTHESHQFSDSVDSFTSLSAKNMEMDRMMSNCLGSELCTKLKQHKRAIARWYSTFAQVKLWWIEPWSSPSIQFIKHLPTILLFVRIGSLFWPFVWLFIAQSPNLQFCFY